MLIHEEFRLAVPKENIAELVCVNAGNNQIDD
jgi:hypothetical protein